MGRVLVGSVFLSPFLATLDLILRNVPGWRHHTETNRSLTSKLKGRLTLPGGLGLLLPSAFDWQSNC